MPLPPGEPDSPQAVAAWLERQVRRRDRFERVRRQSEEHRLTHGPGCSVYPTSSGPLIGVLAGAVHAERILESGGGLGYSALWLAHGAGAHARVETIERDPLHAGLAVETFRAEGLAARIALLPGKAADVLPTLTGPYDMVFCDADPDDYPLQLDQFLRLLRAGGLLVSANLFLGQYTTDLPGMAAMAAYRERILSDDHLLTAFSPNGLGISVRREAGSRPAR